MERKVKYQQIIKFRTEKNGTKKKIRIGINGSMLDEKPTGVGIYTYNLINSLEYILRNDYTNPITVFSPTNLFLSDKIVFFKLPELLQSSKYGKIAAITRFIWNSVSYPFWADKFDVVISPTTHGSFNFENQIITIHDLLSLKYKNISFHQRLYFKYLLPQLIRKAKIIVAVSETTKKEIIQYFGCPESKIKVIYNGYDYRKYYPGISESDIISKQYSIKNYFLAVGPTYPHKNYIFLINTYSKLSPELRIKHPLVIAGGKEKYLTHIKKFVKDNNLEKNVHFLGYVPSQFMAPLYREALSLIFPSLHEGFGFPALEAMACGCPVLASKISSNLEVCEESACYFDPTDQDSLQNAMKQIMTNTKYRDELRKNGIKRATEFTWEKTAISYKNIVETYFNI